MKITDLEGREIVVTDLQLALLQADDYRHYQHFDPALKQSDERQKAYWEDVYQKLLRLKND